MLSSLSREASGSGAPCVSESTHPIKFGNHVTVHRPPADRPSAPQAYQCKITQSTGMVIQMQLEVILAGNRIAARVTTQERRKRKAEIVSVSVLSKVLSLD